MNKVYFDVKLVLLGIFKDNMMIMLGGFGFCGIVEELFDVICEFGVKGLIVVFNNVGVDGIGFSCLFEM